MMGGVGNAPLRYLSVCSGIEAAGVWADLGWQCAGVAEIEPFPCQVLGQRLGAGRPRYMPDPEAEGLSAKDARHRVNAIKAMNSRHMRWGNELINFGDFTQIREDDVGPIDLLVGGTPCQSFSIAGKRLGLDDPRGHLTLEFLALAKRLRARWVCWENVPGVLSHDDGRTFGTFLGFLAECGFERWSYRVLDAQYVRVGRFGRAVPQRRRRVFVVGYSGTADIHPRAVLFDRDSLRGDPAPRREAGERTAPTLAARTRGGPMNSGKDYKARATDVAQPLLAGGPVGGNQGGDFIAFDTTQITSAANRSVPKPGGPCHPLAAGAHPPAIAFAAQGGGDQTTLGFDPEAGTSMTLGACQTTAVAFDMRGREGGSAPEGPHDTANIRAADGGSSRSYVAAEWGVRRLMPIECERLQAFPDGYTQIEWRGKPAEQCPDGPRYKALGNSMARNVMAWLGERIDAVEAAATTTQQSEAA